jgi:molecular chaperone DnaK
MEGTDPEALKQATERLSQAAMKIGEHMYKAQQETPDAGAPPGGENVVDAEFEDLDDSKKK